MIMSLPTSRRALKVLLQTRRVATDACGIPLKPTWSLRELISSYPSPALSPATFRRLHDLAALIPPAQGTRQYDITKRELDELIKLVEAIKLVDIDLSTDPYIPDGRVWAENVGIPLTKESFDKEIRGNRLLQYANRTLDGMYVVETDRER